MAIVSAFDGGTVTFHANEWGIAGRDAGEVDVGLKRIQPANEYWLHYWLRLNRPWIEGRGGKFPGLAGGRATSGGAQIHPEGWSSRIMWGEQRDGLREYRYDQDRKGRWGDSYAWSEGRFLDPGEWHRIVQHVRINTPDRRDGRVQFWLNGISVLRDNTVRWRGDVAPNKARVDRVRMSIFRGGNTASWSVAKETRVSFSDFYVLDCQPDMRKGDPSTPPVCQGEEIERVLVATIELEDGVLALQSPGRIQLFKQA